MKNELNNYFQGYIEKSSIGAKNKVVNATVISIDRQKGFVVVDANLKSEGIISIDEFFLKDEKENLKVNDIIKVYVTDKERDGKTVLSREKATREESLEALKKCYETNQPCQGIIMGKVKGGLSVDLNGAQGFLPGSQIDFETVKDISNLMHKKIDFKVLKIKTTGHGQTVVLSRKAVLEDQTQGDRQQFLDTIKEGDTIEGVVKNITEYGAFIKIHYGVDGLLYLTDISWEEIRHPSEALELNQRIKVKVLKIDQNNKISLGLKQLTSNPWNNIEEKYPVGSIVDAKVIEIGKYEINVEIEKSIHGSINENDFSWSRKQSIEQFNTVEIDQTIKAKVLYIDSNNKKIALGIKHLTENPSEKELENLKENDQIKVKIISLNENGIFVEIKPGIEGKIAIQDISWERVNSEHLKQFSENQEINVVYLGRSQNKELKFGIKQLTQHPFDKHADKIKIGKKVTVEIINISDKKFIEVKLFDEIKTIIKAEDLSKNPKDQKTIQFAVGNKLDAKIIHIDQKSRKISLSVKELEEDEYQNTIKKYGSSQSGASLASVLGAIEEE